MGYHFAPETLHNPAYNSGDRNLMWKLLSFPSIQPFGVDAMRAGFDGRNIKWQDVLRKAHCNIAIVVGAAHLYGPTGLLRFYIDHPHGATLEILDGLWSNCFDVVPTSRLKEEVNKFAIRGPIMTLVKNNIEKELTRLVTELLTDYQYSGDVIPITRMIWSWMITQHGFENASKPPLWPQYLKEFFGAIRSKIDQDLQT